VHKIEDIPESPALKKPVQCTLLLPSVSLSWGSLVDFSLYPSASLSKTQHMVWRQVWGQDFVVLKQ
jgi:hypothetical protein